MFKVLLGFLKNKNDDKVPGCKEPSDSRRWHGEEIFAKQPEV